MIGPPNDAAGSFPRILSEQAAIIQSKVNGIIVQSRSYLLGSAWERSAAADLFRAVELGMRGGKCLRGYVLIEACRLQLAKSHGSVGVVESSSDGDDVVDHRLEAALAAAAAVEMIHAYSLIHDDLPAMDDADLRRGQPTLHRTFDEATAILAGDGLLTLAFECLAGLQLAADLRLRLVMEMSKAAGICGMVAGQALDMATDWNVATEAQVLELQALKTGRLFEFALFGGGLIGGAKANELEQLVQYGNRLGLAFQLQDDRLDQNAVALQIGKPARQDNTHDRPNFGLCFGWDRLDDKLKTTVQEGLQALYLFHAEDPDAESLSAESSGLGLAICFAGDRDY